MTRKKDVMYLQNEKGELHSPFDYELSLLSEANGMTLLVSEKGQVFYVKKKGEKVSLKPLNEGGGPNYARCWG